ncbi:MAG TPA: di-heme oxidoredictase family protein [Vicinamibacteria bacterium]|nr:di-heme oxidoredictase family protein [Vicinamibacteria bacterium]
MAELKLFRDGKAVFSEVEEDADGLGPIFNNTGCAVCHLSPAVGGASDILETRAARVANGRYFELPGGSLFQDHSTTPGCAETIPPEANVIAKRQTTPLFGVGLIEAIPDRQIEAYRADEMREHPGQAGHIHRVVDVATGATRVGRFGWKSQQATLLSFSGDAYVNEMGVTSRLFPAENAPNGDQAKLASCDKVADFEDNDDDIVLFTNFMRFLAPPPREGDRFRDHNDRNRDGSRDGRGGDRGEHLFEQVGCEVCHHSGFRAVSDIRALNGQTVDAFSDFLLHDIGTGDGIVQGEARGNEIRTTPLWGLSESAPYLHDGSAPTINDAIRRHGNQAGGARRAFFDLSSDEQRALLNFLDSI